MLVLGYDGSTYIGYDHINRKKSNAPVLVRSRKLTRFEPAQYWGGGPPGTVWCCIQVFQCCTVLLCCTREQCANIFNVLGAVVSFLSGIQRRVLLGLWLHYGIRIRPYQP